VAQYTTISVPRDLSKRIAVIASRLRIPKAKVVEIAVELVESKLDEVEKVIRGG